MDEINEKIIEIFSGTLWEAEIVKSLLQDSGIKSFLQNSIGNSYEYSPIIAAGVKVMILNSDTERATEIVEEYCRNMKTDLK